MHKTVVRPRYDSLEPANDSFENSRREVLILSQNWSRTVLKACSKPIFVDTCVDCELGA